MASRFSRMSGQSVPYRTAAEALALVAEMLDPILAGRDHGTWNPAVSAWEEHPPTAGATPATRSPSSTWLIAFSGLDTERARQSRIVGILSLMTKRLIDIDEALLEQARLATGATNTQDTVNTALRHTIEAELRRRHVQRLADLDGTDLADDEVMAAAWR